MEVCILDNTIKGKKTILIVDDEKPIVDILVYNLQKEGYETLEAYDGETAVELEIDKILGLELGADDYVTKPFSVRELMARVKANLRKVEVSQEPVEDVKEEIKPKKQNKIEVGDLYLDLDKFEVKIRGREINLTLREFEVLKYLAKQPGQVVTRETLLEKVWGYEYYGDIRTVDVTVRRIREKIEKDTSSPKILITKRGVGYYISSK